MKVLVAVALFACVALQMSHGAPAPEEEKKVEAAPAATAAITPVEAVEVPVADVKAAPPSDAAAPAAPAEGETTPAPAKGKPSPAASEGETTTFTEKKA